MSSPVAPAVVAPNPANITSAQLAGSEKAWEPATATTWINVRSGARVDAPIVRILKPNDVVQLGTRTGGWRLVRGGGFSGWAGARHFAVNQR
ncbi:MAG: SH3 domain-containing protein [Gemmatimonadaceae bacterium]